MMLSSVGWRREQCAVCSVGPAGGAAKFIMTRRKEKLRLRRLTEWAELAAVTHFMKLVMSTLGIEQR